MKMVMISADDYEKLSKAKEESETKIESYKQCIAGYESRIKELTEERDKLKDQYRSSVAKRVLNSAYGVEQDICRMISNSLNKSIADKVNELSEENKKLKDCKDMYEDKLKNTEATLKAVAIDKFVRDSVIKTLRSQAEEDANKMKELRQKYETVLKANEKLAAENSRLTNDPEIIRLNNELKILKKQYTDLNNAYKSQKNTLYKLTKSSDDTNDILRSQYSCLLKDYERVKLAREEAIKEIKSLNARLSQVATKVAKIYNNTIVDTHTLNTLVEDLKNYI